MAQPKILQSSLDPVQRSIALRPLPSMQPVGKRDWITVDDAYTAQLVEKARLIETMPDQVLRTTPSATDALAETLEEILKILERRSDFEVRGTRIRRPDSTEIELRLDEPLETISKLIQEDICILQKQDDEHALSAALLCFPASWTLSEKIGKPLTQVHTPVSEYDANIARRVQRLFDGVKLDRPMWRANLLTYTDHSLYHPRTEADPRDNDHENGGYERSERQTVWRLPKTDAVVFSIHTTVSQIA